MTIDLSVVGYLNSMARQQVELGDTARPIFELPGPFDPAEMPNPGITVDLTDASSDGTKGQAGQRFST